MNASPASVVSARKLGLTFQTSDGPLHALSDVDLEVEKGDFVSFIGPSGCGKTTFLRVIADLEKNTAGEITINGMTPEEARKSRCYGYVFQAPALYPWRTIEKNVSLPLEIMGHGKTEQQERVRRTLDLVNLSGFGKKYPWQLSGGMQQRASIAPRARLRRRPAADGRTFRGPLDEIVRDHLNEQLLKLWAANGKDHLLRHPTRSRRRSTSPPRSSSCRRGPAGWTDVIHSTLPRERPLEIRETPEFLAIAHRVREGTEGGGTAMRSETFASRVGPVLTIVATIIVIWYAAAVWMNAPFQRDLDRRGDVTSTTMEFIVKTLSQPKPIVPAPHQVAQNVFENTFLRKVTSNRSLVYHSWITLSSTLAGFAFGTLLGVLIAVGIVHVKALDRSLMPWIIASQTVPILAIAPDGGRRAGGNQRHRSDPEGADLHLPVVLPGGRRHGEGPPLAGHHPARPDADL
jgi:NitT/TauT family transport system ATP-binding protein